MSFKIHKIIKINNFNNKFINKKMKIFYNNKNNNNKNNSNTKQANKIQIQLIYNNNKLKIKI